MSSDSASIRSASTRSANASTFDFASYRVAP
jgi:hypothetical protein